MPFWLTLTCAITVVIAVVHLLFVIVYPERY